MVLYHGGLKLLKERKFILETSAPYVIARGWIKYAYS